REACRVPPEVLTREVRVVGFNPARRLARCTAEERKQLFDRLATWMSAGRLRTKIAAVYPIDRAVEGYERIRKVGDKRFGKVVIRIQSLPPPEREEAKEEDSAAPEPLDMPPMDEAPAPAA
ncbi:MAG TPA: zinc-binding dehydrogenase, partial [Steroidobacteraceae bacterium]|nr:zinc-binding dehydrogenase [Steroidobacteraceae bacterium]